MSIDHCEKNIERHTCIVPVLLSVGPLGHSLVETCLRLAAVLLLNGQQDKASQCLTLCDYQLQAKVQVF